MFDKKEELERISRWMSKLNTYNPGWISGDLEDEKNKTADLVNREIQCAIELKREKGNSVDNVPGNITTLSNRLESYFKEANRKFKNYKEYKTILLIELQSNFSIAQAAMSGIPQIHLEKGELIGTSIKNKKLYSEANSIGSIVMWPTPGNISFLNKSYYFDNPFSQAEYKVSHQEAEKIFGNHLKFLELNN